MAWRGTLRRDVNIATLEHLPSHSTGPRADIASRVDAMRAQGVTGVQAPDPLPYVRAGFIGVGMGRIVLPKDASEVITRLADSGVERSTVHVGTGLESDADMDRLAASILEASTAHRHMVLVETHRATMTQDMRRTVDLVGRFPDLRFNADFSHWYLGQEMPYGDIKAKLSFLAPVFSRVRYMHLRLGTSGAIQVNVDAAIYPEAIAHWNEIHLVCLNTLADVLAPNDILPVAPELLACRMDTASGLKRIDYALERVGPDGMSVEVGDRWADMNSLFKMIDDLVVHYRAGRPLEDLGERHRHKVTLGTETALDRMEFVAAI